MVLPLSLLRSAQGHPMMVELKNGDTYNGHLVNCDSWMNLNLREVVCTSREGDKFWRMPECYIRGNTIKYLRIPEEVMSLVKEEDADLKNARVKASRGRLGRGRGRGRGRTFRGRGRGGNMRGRGGRGGHMRGRGGNMRGRGGSSTMKKR
eukprot:447505_1